MIDFRQADHVEKRIGRFHGRPPGFNLTVLDGSAGLHRELEPRWQKPLP